MAQHQMNVQLPPAFDADNETSKFLARVKRRASKDFGWSRRHCLEDAMWLAYWLHVFGENLEALEICVFLGGAQFTGDTNLWTWVEGSLALQSRLLRFQHKQTEAATCVKRIRVIMERTFSPGVPERRLTGEFLRPYDQNARHAVDQAEKGFERSFRLMVLKEACTLIELGGSLTLPVADLETQYQENLRRLKALA